MKMKKRLSIGQRGLSKQPANLRNLITRLITTLFKIFGLHVDPCNR